MKKRKGITAALAICLVLAAAFAFLPRNCSEKENEYYFGEEEKEEAQDTLPEEEKDAEEENKEEQTETEEKEETGKDENVSPGGTSPGWTPSPGPSGGGQGGGYSEEPPVPLYDYFTEGGYLICKGCYKPFADVRALNAHICEGYHSSECEHEWEAEYNDVWVEAKGHWEYGIVSEEWDEPVYEERCVCKKCGEYFLNSEEVSEHIISVHGNEGSWTVAQVVVSYVHHDAVYGDIFVTDEEAHLERLLYRYRCVKCGEIKYPE